MAGLLFETKDRVWALDPWGSALHCLGRTGHIDRTWTIPFETDSHTRLISESGGIGLAGDHLVTASRACGAEVGYIRVPDADSDPVELTVRALACPCAGPYAVAGNGAQAILVGDGGDCIARVTPRVDTQLQLAHSAGHGHCGILSGAACAQGRLAVASHVFGECFTLGNETDVRWVSVPTPGLKEPYLIAEAPERFVVLGKAVDGRWFIRDGDDLIVVEDALDAEDTPRGFLVLKGGYAVLRESAEPACSVVILQRTGDSCRTCARTRF